MSSRPRRRAPKRVASNARNMSSGLERVDTELKKLVVMQNQQCRYPLPNTLDVPFPMLKQHTFSTVAARFAFNVVASTTAASNGGYYFALSQLNLSTSFTQLFDRYRVLHIQLQFCPQVAAPTGGGPLITSIDYDDSSTPSVEIQQRDTNLTVPVGTYFERSYIPRLATAAYSGSFTGYANTPPTMWIDSSSPNVQFYGLKYSLPVQTTATTVYSVTYKVHLQFKNNF